MRLSLLAAGLLVLGLACSLAAAQEAGTAVDETVETAADTEVSIDPTEEPVAEAAAETPPAEASDPEEPTSETPESAPAEATADDSEPAAIETPEDAVEDDAAPAEALAEEGTTDEEAAGDIAEEAVAEEDVVAEGTDWAGLIERAPAFLALTHHAAVHLPIALWLFGAFFVLVGVVMPSWRNQIPLACLIGGMLTSVAAAATGWWYAQFEYADEWAWGDMIDREKLAEGIVQHRWIAVALVIASVILSVIALISQAKQSKGLGFVWRVGLLLLAAAVAYEGHIGGELIHGEGFIEEAFQEWVAPEE